MASKYLRGDSRLQNASTVLLRAT